MKRDVINFLNGTIGNQLGGIDRPARIYYHQVKSCVEAGFFTIDEFNSVIEELELKFMDESVFKLLKIKPMEAALRRVYKSKGFLKLFHKAQSGMCDNELLTEIYADILYCFD